ncbi:MAG: UDP-N-acetylmuramoyl-tripeptide--D-alanyl-D-alanine ligase [Acetobacteraceae bacterium]|nr:UDP-N-acetylmuramoyl-tripeptide--D-alanyl-D-alanine ligase [Acetobacteraceae bacterium]
MTCRSVPLWTAADLHEATCGVLTAEFAAAGVSIDSRTVQAGDLFVALRGENGDGHRFVADAIVKGAAGAMVHEHIPGVLPLLRVDDTLAALARLGAYARSRFEGRLVAITGSVGKTTTKEMLRTILSPLGLTHAAAASYNNHWGLPLTLARLPPEAAFCVAEIGMNHAGEIAPLARLARPHVAVITAVETAHIGYLGGIEAIANEKASLLQGLEPGGIAVLPADSPLLPRLRAAAGGAEVVTFGTAAWADARLIALTSDADGSDIEAEIEGVRVQFRLNAPGVHMVMNAMAAIAAAVHLSRLAGEVGAQRRVRVLRADPITLTRVASVRDLSRIAKEVSSFKPITGRGARRFIAVPGGSALLLDESYNANPASVRAALAVLKLQPARRRIAVLGDMLELGDSGPTEHESLAAEVAACVDLLFACGPLMRRLFDAVPARLRAAHAIDSVTLAPLVARSIAAGDAILVKGSLGSRMKAVVTTLDSLVVEAG